jgi:hypothetical protein
MANSEQLLEVSMSMASATETTIRPHNEAPSAAWSSAGRAYDEVSRGIIDAIEHCINRLSPKPGERILDVATGTPDGNVFEMWKIMKPFMPEPAGPPPPSPFEWGVPERLEELLGDAFELTLERGTSFYREPNGLAAWEIFSAGYGPLRAMAGKLDAKRREELKRDFVAFHNRFPTELGICVPREYWVVVGTRR